MRSRALAMIDAILDGLRTGTIKVASDAVRPAHIHDGQVRKLPDGRWEVVPQDEVLANCRCRWEAKDA